MRFLNRIAETCRRVLGWLISSTIALLLTIMVLQIVFRYGFNSSLIWAEEVCRYLLIWVSFLAAFSALERGEIAAVTVLRDRLPRKAGLVAALIGNALALALLGVLVVYGLRYAGRIGSQPIPGFGFLLDDLFGAPGAAPAMFWVYLALPVGMALLAVRVAADTALYALMFASGEAACDLRGGDHDGAQGADA